VLLSAAQMIGKSIRDTDFLARYGGEEFALLMRDARVSQAETRLSAMLESIARSSFEYQNRRDAPPVQFTLSCGITEFSSGDTPAEIMARADEALYEAKRRGKNQVRSKKKSFLSSLLERRKNPQE
jgi:diguanylate cyclase